MNKMEYVVWYVTIVGQAVTVLWKIDWTHDTDNVLQ